MRQTGSLMNPYLDAVVRYTRAVPFAGGEPR